MKINNYLKKIWKSILPFILKIYTNNYKLHIQKYSKDHAAEKFYSQFGQDLFVFKNIFKEKKGGLFVDVGANHPINGSNTYLLELNDWKGLAIEPQQSLRELWPKLRKTKCLNYVVGPENKEVSFIEGGQGEDGLSGVEGFNKCSNKFNKISIQQRKLSDILSENSITDIDYLSIDVEGYEINVLKSINFAKVNIKLIGLENDLGFKNLPLIGKRLGSELGNNEIRKFLKDKGYKYTARIVCDDFFIREQ